MNSRVVEDYDEQGPVRRRNNNENDEEGSNNRGPLDYPERNPLDLIEEDKRPFVRRKLLTTCCGGFRIVYDEVTQETLHPALFIMQILTYGFFPGLILLSVLGLFPDQDQRFTAAGFVAVIALVACGLLQASSFMMKSKEMAAMAEKLATEGQKNKNDLRNAAGSGGFSLRPRDNGAGRIEEENSDTGFCSKKTLYFLVPPKETICELLTVIVVASLYGFFATYLAHPKTAAMAITIDEDEQTTCTVLAIIVVFFTSYSLLSKPIPEVTPYGTDDSFSVFSHHYQRAWYVIIVNCVVLIAEKGFESAVMVNLLLPGVYWANLFILILQMIGWISNPFVSVLYFMEQGEILFLGGTARASDSRILISFVVNCLFVTAFTHTDVSTEADLTIVYAVAAFFLSKNYLHTLGLKHPYKIQNKDMDKQRSNAEIVFANLERDSSHKEAQFCSPKTLIYNFVGFFMVITTAISFQVVYGDSDNGKEVVQDWTADNVEQKRKNMIPMLAGFGCGLGGVIFIVSSLSKRSIFRCIPCPNIQVPAEVTRIATYVMQVLAVGLATVLVLNQTQARWFDIAPRIPTVELSFLTEVDNLSKGINVLLSLRAFKRAMTAPMLFQFEVLVAWITINAMKDDPDFWMFWVHKYGMLGLLVFAHFVIHRGRVLFNKLVYLVVSFITAFKNKKQRIRSQWICITLQCTFLLPYFAAVLIFTTFFDVALVPTFGFAFFTAGYLKPLRSWSAISPVEANPKDSVSDGHLFQAMQSQLNEQIRDMVLRDPSNFEAGSFYLLKNEKMIILVHILERSDGFVVFTSKGTELQETTICHAEENANINEVMNKVFEKNEIHPEILFSLSPIRQVEFSLYKDLKYSLTGLITDQTYAEMTKRYFMSILARRLEKLFSQNAGMQMVRISMQDLAGEDKNRAASFIDDSWLRHLGILDKTFVYHQLRAEATTVNAVPSAGGAGMTFLERINQEQRQNDSRSPALAPLNDIQEGTTSGRNRFGPAKLAEDRMFEDLENMLQEPEQPNTGKPGSSKATKFQIGAALAGTAGLVRRGSSSQIVPINAVDDLEDIYDFGSKRQAGATNSKTTIGSVHQQARSSQAVNRAGLPPLANVAATKSAVSRSILKAADKDDLDDELADFDEELSRPRGQDTATNNSPSPKRDVEYNSVKNYPRQLMNNDVEVVGSAAVSQTQLLNPISEHNLSVENNDASQFKRRQQATSALDDLADLDDLMEGGESESGSVKQFLAEAFIMIFKDDFTQFPSAMQHAFNGTVQSTIETRKFLASNDVRALILKHEVMYAARLAMHLSTNKFVMGDFDMETGQDLENAIDEVYGKWFLGGEPFLWNMAIERRMPQLQRIITKKGAYFIHELKYAEASDPENRFSVFEFRREVARGIWANLNSELIYYTNANDERFSIQAEKDILRNLLVHLAEIPLGYPAYASGAQTLYY